MLDIFTDLSGLRSVFEDIHTVLDRIACALERVAPPLPILPPEPQGASDPRRPADDASANGFHLSESAEEYESRRTAESAFAASLSVVPYSPAFQKLIDQMRADVLSQVHTNEEGIEVPYTEAEADDIVRQAFQAASAAANVRT